MFLIIINHEHIEWLACGGSCQSVERTWRDKPRTIYKNPACVCDKINVRQAYKGESIDNAVFGISETAEKLAFYKL